LTGIHFINKTLKQTIRGEGQRKQICIKGDMTERSLANTLFHQRFSNKSLLKCDFLHNGEECK